MILISLHSVEKSIPVKLKYEVSSQINPRMQTHKRARESVWLEMKRWELNSNINIEVWIEQFNLDLYIDLNFSAVQRNNVQILGLDINTVNKSHQSDNILGIISSILSMVKVYITYVVKCWVYFVDLISCLDWLNW